STARCPSAAHRKLPSLLARRLSHCCEQRTPRGIVHRRTLRNPTVRALGYRWGYSAPPPHERHVYSRTYDRLRIRPGEPSRDVRGRPLTSIDIQQAAEDSVSKLLRVFRCSRDVRGLPPPATTFLGYVWRYPGSR